MARNELTFAPMALAGLQRQLAEQGTTAQDLMLRLRALQRLGLTRAELQVHVERIRAANEVTTDDETIEDNALLALDLIAGQVSNYSLRWDPAEIASIYLPKALTPDMLGRNIPAALAPSNMLPPRPEFNLPASIRDQVLAVLQTRLENYASEPQKAEFFRVPKSGMTTRPAALLAPQDRLVFQALAEEISGDLDEELPSAVVWPRPNRAQEAPYEEFSGLPRQWQGNYVVVTDIESFYECVDHSLLVTFIGERLNARTPYLHAVESFLDAVMGSSAGLPQGPAASEILASAYLLPIDSRMTEAGWTFSRYADDYLISAHSIVDGRRKLEQFETMLREVGLRLNVSKTRVMRSATYVGFLNKPSRRVGKLRERIRRLAENYLRETEDADEVERILRNIGVDEELLWDLLYHHTTTMDEVIATVRDQLRPPLVEAYARYFEQLARPLRRDHLPDDMLSAEKDLRECLTFMASAQYRVDLSLVDQTLRWFPRLTRHAAAYLKAIAPSAESEVAQLLLRWLQPARDTDWVTAWLCSVSESTPRLVTLGLRETLQDLIQDSQVGLLTRTGAARALAAAGQLDADLWKRILAEAPSAIRSELLLSSLAEPDRYPRGNHALEPGGLM